MLGTILGSDHDIQTMTSETSTITKEMLEKEGLVDFDDTHGQAKFIEVICSPVRFDKLGSDSLGDMFETFLDPEINVDLAFNTSVKDFVDSFWHKSYNKIVLMLILTRLLPLIAQNLLLFYPRKTTFTLSLVIEIIVFMYEMKSLIMLGFKKHFENMVNYIDFFGHLAGIIWVYSMFEMDFSCHDNDEALLSCVYT